MTNNHDPKAELPAGWIEVELGAFLEFEYGKGLTKKQRNEDGEFPVYGSNGIVGYHDEFLIEGPVLIVGRKGAAGEVALSQEDCWPIDTTYFVRVPNDLSLTFCFHLLKSLRLDQFDRSTAIPGLNRNDAYRVRINLPPLPEQHRIVDKIEELFSDLDHSVAALETARQQLDIYRQAVLKHAFEGKLTAQWRKDHPDLTGFQNLSGLIRAERKARRRQELDDWQAEVEAWEAQGKPGRKPRKPRKPKRLPPLTEAELNELPSLPEGWGWVRFGLLVQNSQNGLSKRSGKKGTPTKVLRLADITDGKISDLDPRRITITQDEFEKYVLSKNDFVCIRVNGSPDLVGRLILVKDNGDWAFCDHFIRVRLLTGSHVPEYIRYLADTQLVRKFIRLNVVSSAGQNTVSQATLLSMPIPLCEKSEQHAIVEEIEARLSVVDKLAETIDAALQQAAALRQSILKQTFAGKLVPQNPNDEPAEKLLERIEKASP